MPVVVAPPTPEPPALPKLTATDRRKADQEKAAAQRAERAERDRLAREEKADRERAARAEREKAAQEKADRGKADREARAERERLAKEEKADRERNQRAEREKAGAEKAAADKAAAEKAAADKAAADKARVAVVTPTPPAAPVKRKGLDPTEVKAVIARTGAAFDECVRAASGGPDAQYVGRSVDLYVEVSPAGSANDAFVDDDGLTSSQLGKCLKKAAMRMSFTPYDGEPVPVRVPLRLGQR